MINSSFKKKKKKRNLSDVKLSFRAAVDVPLLQ